MKRRRELSTGGLAMAGDSFSIVGSNVCGGDVSLVSTLACLTPRDQQVNHKDGGEPQAEGAENAKQARGACGNAVVVEAGTVARDMLHIHQYYPAKHPAHVDSHQARQPGPGVE